MWSASETVHDCLRFSQYVQSLAEVCVEKGIAPLTLGIFGMLEEWQDEPDEDATESHQCTAGGWRKNDMVQRVALRRQGEIQAALINAILMKVKEGKTLGQDVVEVLERLKDGASILKLAKFIGRTAITLTPDI